MPRLAACGIVFICSLSMACASSDDTDASESGADSVDSALATMDWAPGHYLLLTFKSQNGLTPELDAALSSPAVKSAFVGIQARYDWNELEPTAGQYNFAVLRSHLD